MIFNAQPRNVEFGKQNNKLYPISPIHREYVKFVRDYVNPQGPKGVALFIIPIQKTLLLDLSFICPYDVKEDFKRDLATNER